MEDEALEMHDWNAGMQDGWDDGVDADPEASSQAAYEAASATGHRRLSVLPRQHAAAIEALRAGAIDSPRTSSPSKSDAIGRGPLQAALALPQPRGDARGPAKRLAVAQGAGRPRALRGDRGPAFHPGAGTDPPHDEAIGVAAGIESRFEGGENSEEAAHERPWVPPGRARPATGSGARLGPRRGGAAVPSPGRATGAAISAPGCAVGGTSARPGHAAEGAVTSPTGSSGPRAGSDPSRHRVARGPSRPDADGPSREASSSPSAASMRASFSPPSPAPRRGVRFDAASAPAHLASLTPTLVLGRGAHAGAGSGGAAGVDRNAARAARGTAHRRPAAPPVPTFALPRDAARQRRADASPAPTQANAFVPRSPVVFRASDLVASPGLPSIGRPAFPSRMPTPTRLGLTGSARRVAPAPAGGRPQTRAAGVRGAVGDAGSLDGDGDPPAGALPPTPAHLNSALKRLAARGLLGDSRAGSAAGAVSTSVDGYPVLPLPSLPDFADEPARDGLARRLQFADADSGSPHRELRFDDDAEDDDPARGLRFDDAEGGDPARKAQPAGADAGPSRRLSFGAEDAHADDELVEAPAALAFQSPLRAGEGSRAPGAPAPAPLSGDAAAATWPLALPGPTPSAAAPPVADIFGRYAWPGATSADLRRALDSDASDDEYGGSSPGRLSTAGFRLRAGGLLDGSPGAAELAQVASPAEALRGLQQELSEAFEREQEAHAHDSGVESPESRADGALRIPAGTPAREAALMRRAAAAEAEGARLRELAGHAAPPRGRSASLASDATPLLVPNGAPATPLLAPGSYEGADGIRRDAYGVPHETPPTVTARRRRGGAAERPRGSDGGGRGDAVRAALAFAEVTGGEGGAARGGGGDAYGTRDISPALSSAEVRFLSPPAPPFLDEIDRALRGASLNDQAQASARASASLPSAPSPAASASVSTALPHTASASLSTASAPLASSTASASTPAFFASRSSSTLGAIPVRTPSPLPSAPAALAVSATPSSPSSPSTPTDPSVVLPGTPPETPFVAPTSPPTSALPGRALPRSALKPGGTLGRAARINEDERRRQDAHREARVGRALAKAAAGDGSLEGADSPADLGSPGAPGAAGRRRASRATRELHALMADLELHGDPAAAQLQTAAGALGPVAATSVAATTAPLGTLPLLSPVRAPRTAQAARGATRLGDGRRASLVATPVRRSARLLSDSARPDASGALDAAGFAYAPNPNFSMVQGAALRGDDDDGVWDGAARGNATPAWGSAARSESGTPSGSVPSSASALPRASPATPSPSPPPATTPSSSTSSARRSRSSASPASGQQRRATGRDPELSPTEQSLRRSLRLSAKKGSKRA